jgi:hypothetical protein
VTREADTTSPLLAQSIFGDGAVPRAGGDAAPTTASVKYEYKPFLTPLPVWDHWVWLIVPLCVGVSVVYKSAKCWKMTEVPRESMKITFYILGAMVMAAAVIWTVTWAATPR